MIRRPLRAAWTAANSALGSNGLRRKSTAPPAIACCRRISSSCAVTKMTGMRECAAFNRRCSSSPSIPGIRTSSIRHFVCFRAVAFKSSSAAEAKVATLCPTDLRRVLVESRTDSSSSTIEIKSSLLNVMSHPHLPPFAGCAGDRMPVSRSATQWHATSKRTRLCKIALVNNPFSRPHTSASIESPAVRSP